MKYGYVRVSSQTQNIARQMEEMYKLGLTDDVIFVDRQSGKDFDRTSYKILKSKLKQGDLLIIKSIDRLGRNYDMIINEWQDITKVIDADIFVVAAFGQILSKEILDIPRYGCINVHGSLLPKYRGSAPIQRAVINGERITGVSTMYLASEMDAGDVIYTAETEIGATETSGELFDRLADMGAALLVKTVRAIEDGSAPRTPQEHEKATYAPPLSKDEAAVDWTKTPDMVLKHIYGMQPWPCAAAALGGTQFKIFRAEKTGRTSAKAAGTVVSADKKGVEVVCGGGETVLVTELQAAGGKRMDAGAYLLGHPMEVG